MISQTNRKTANGTQDSENLKSPATENKTGKRIIIYLSVTFLMTYLYEIGIVWPAVKSVNLLISTLSQLLIGAAMFFPALGVLITRLVTKEGFQNSMIRPNLKGHMLYYIMAWFGPSILIAIGALIYFLLYPAAFDPSMSDMLKLLKEQALASGAAASSLSAISPIVFYVQLVFAILFAPILNIVTCLGEEWGWRGYLLPKMQENLPLLPMLLINGIIWGLWHAPLTIIGHNYGLDYPGFPYIGILAMCLFCTVIGILFSYVTIKTGSCLPAALAHGALNGFVSAPSFFTKAGFGNPFIGPLSTGIIGGIGFVFAAVVALVLLFKEGKKGM